MRHFDELGPRLRALVLQNRELSDGYDFQFPGDRSTFQVIAEWTAGEHVCCPFFDISIRLDREGGGHVDPTNRPARHQGIHPHGFQTMVQAVELTSDNHWRAREKNRVTCICDSVLRTGRLTPEASSHLWAAPIRHAHSRPDRGPRTRKSLRVHSI
jgi:hypothetical protein